MLSILILVHVFIFPITLTFSSCVYLPFKRIHKIVTEKSVTLSEDSRVRNFTFCIGDHSFQGIVTIDDHHPSKGKRWFIFKLKYLKVSIALGDLRTCTSYPQGGHALSARQSG